MRKCIHDYTRDEEPGPVPTDVFSLLVDSAQIEADTWLCTYFGPASEGLRNEDARRKVEIPETREKLRADLGAEADDDAFRAALHAHCYDLHYAAVEGARPYSFGVGPLWRTPGGWLARPRRRKGTAAVAGAARQAWWNGGALVPDGAG
mgnify:CR=1 FL=1